MSHSEQSYTKDKPFLKETTQLIKIAQRYEDFNSLDEVGLEAGTKLGLFGAAIRNTFSGISDIFVSLTGSDKFKIAPSSYQLSVLSNLLKQRDYEDYKYIETIIPEGLTVTNMKDYTDVLVKAFTELFSIDKRLMTPMIKWAAKVTNHPEQYVSSVYTGSDLLFVKDYSKLKDAIAEFKTNNTDTGNHITELANIYPTPEDLIATAKNVIILQELVKQFEKANLLRRSDVLSSVVNTLLDPEATSDLSSLFPQITVKTLGETLPKIAMELELLAITVFLSKTTIVHFAKVLDDIEGKYKELRNAK